MSRVSATKVLLFIFVSVISVRFYAFTVTNNFYVFTQTPCNAEVNDCFIYECNLEGAENCSNIFLQEVVILANKAPQCVFENNCESFECKVSHSCTTITSCILGLTTEDEACFSKEVKDYGNS